MPIDIVHVYECMYVCMHNLLYQLKCYKQNDPPGWCSINKCLLCVLEINFPLCTDLKKSPHDSLPPN